MRFGGLIAAIVIAALAALLVLRYTSHEEPAQTATNAPPPVKTINIYVASQAAPVGAVLTQEMIAVQPWPENLLIEGFIRTDSGTNIIGMVTRAPFQAQEPFRLSSLAKPGDPNFLAGNLPKGMRVITIQTNEIEGIGGFVFPGDHIDLLLTHPVMKWVTPPAVPGAANVGPHQETDSVTETLLSNVLIVAVDQRSTAANTVDKNGNLLVPRSVSLMVTPNDAQKVRLGAQKGTLTLSLRSLQDKETVDEPLLTTSSDITQYQQDTGGGANDSGIMVVRGVTGLQSASSPGIESQATQTSRPAVTGHNSATAPHAVAAPGALTAAPPSPAVSLAPTAPPPVASPSPMLPPTGNP